MAGIYKLWESIKASLIAIANSILVYFLKEQELQVMIMGIINSIFVIIDFILKYLENKKTNK